MRNRRASARGRIHVTGGHRHVRPGGEPMTALRGTCVASSDRAPPGLSVPLRWTTYVAALVWPDEVRRPQRLAGTSVLSSVGRSNLVAGRGEVPSPRREVRPLSAAPSVLGFPLAVRQKYSDDQGGSLAAMITYCGFLRSSVAAGARQRARVSAQRAPALTTKHPTRRSGSSRRADGSCKSVRCMAAGRRTGST